MTANAAHSGLDSDRLLSPEQAAMHLHCSAQTLARWRCQGVGPRWLKIGPRRVVYALADLNAFMTPAKAS
jgi:hypothetical protein